MGFIVRSDCFFWVLVLHYFIECLRSSPQRGLDLAWSSCVFLCSIFPNVYARVCESLSIRGGSTDVLIPNFSFFLFEILALESGKVA